MDLCNWIREKEDYKEAYARFLKYICDILDNDPANPKIHRLQDNIPTLKRRIAYLSDKIGIGCFPLYYHNPYPSEQKI